MPAGQQQQKETWSDPWPGSDRTAAVAELEKALQLEPHAADQWCRLGELYDGLACEAPDPQAAIAYRDKAVAALTQAISLAPGLGKAHYALAGVYEAQDPCLALVELEAAAKCDPETYGAPLARAQKAIRDCTHRLSDLNLVSALPEQPQLAAEILQAEFYFDDRPIRSAVLHSCVSEGSRQTAKFWLFESAEPELAADRPLAQITVTSAGNVFLSRGCPANYQQHRAIPVSVPPRRMQSGRSVVLPVALMVIVFGGSLFAYLNLIAPERTASSERTRTASEAPKAVAASSQPVEISPKAVSESPKPAPPTSPEVASAVLAEALPRLASAAPSRADPVTPSAKPQPRNSSPPAEAAPSPNVKARATASIVSREVALAQRVTPPESPVRQVPRPVPPITPAPEGPVGSAATSGTAVELKPLLKEQAVAAPTTPKEPVAAVPPLPSERLAMARAVPSEPVPPPRLALKEPAVAAPSPPKEPSAPASTWTTRLRAELTACGPAGFWRNDICRETTRWNYCHPDRWGTVRECAVERFASSARPE